MNHIFQPIGYFFIRLAISLVFVYFGVLALLDPVTQASLWIQEPFYNLINGILSISIFMVVFGFLEIIIGLAIVLKIWLKLFSALAFILLFGIIVNLGFVAGFTNDIVVRDIALSFVVLGIFLKEMLISK